MIDELKKLGKAIKACESDRIEFKNMIVHRDYSDSSGRELCSALDKGDNYGIRNT